jgi:rubrerythrin
MARIFECPKCGADISDSYEGADPDVGINAGWYCNICDEGYGDEDGLEPHDDDVMVSSTEGSSHTCACGAFYEMGYGFAGGGGIGPYMYCPSCGAIAQKSQDKEMEE